jgi:phosphatidylinositol alpha 1,6-mannosyltransferase
MRIALVTETFYPAVDGTTTTVKAVADRLINLGHEVRLLAPGPGLSSYRGSRIVRPRHLDPSGSQVREALADFRPDLVHVTSPGPLGRKALKHARRLGLATLAVEQSPVLDQTADYWRAKVADRADAVLVTSPWMVERAAELGVHADLWTPGVDTSAFAPHLRDPFLHSRWARAGSPGGPRVVVGHVGGLDNRQDVRRLAGLAAVPGIRPVILGDGQYRGWLEARLPDAKFTGVLGPGDLSVALRRCAGRRTPPRDRAAPRRGRPVRVPAVGGGPRGRPASRPARPAWTRAGNRAGLVRGSGRAGHRTVRGADGDAPGRRGLSSEPPGNRAFVTLPAAPRGPGER